ncbi:lysylphosphatidylglycerol synthase transmembrane domain-containing protein [Ravibacter arvi]|uniref:Lysylphosphatidylglycerol synthase transmembrane domain-containing protein n=1 Tax=Ravibacter arvi TaxID=2051041 RepID=A0ABP8M602_9BACT
MNTRRYKLLFFALGVLTMAVLVYRTGWREMVGHIAGMGYWLAPVIGSWIIIYLLNAWAFHDIIYERDKPETRLAFGRVLQLTISGYAINYITPFVGLGGEPYRIMELRPMLGIARASSAVVQYGLMHMLSHVVFWLFSLVLIVVFLEPGMLLLTGCAALLAAGLLLGFLFMRMYRRGFLVAVLVSVSKWPLVGGKASFFLERHRATLTGIDDQIKTLYADRRSTFYRSMSLEFLARIVGCAEIYFIGAAIHLDMSWLDALIISSGSSLFANLVFFFPMQLGTREGGMALALKSVGLPAASGVFISLVTRIRELFWIAVGYGLMYFQERGQEEIYSIKTSSTKHDKGDLI